MADTSINLPPGFQLEGGGGINLPPGFQLEAAPPAAPAPATDAAPADQSAAPAAAAPPPVASPPSMGQNFVDAVLAGVQGVSPHVKTVQGGSNYVKIGPLINSDAGPMVDLGGGNWHPLDQQTQVVLRDPDTGNLAVYSRNPDMEENRLASLGRVLSYGLVSQPATRLPGGAEAFQPTAAQQLVQDFNKVGVSPDLPAVTQNRGVMAAANTAKNVPVVGQPIIRGAEKRVGEMAAATERTAGEFGTASTPEGAGRIAQTGVENFRHSKDVPQGADAAALPSRATSFAAKGGALYDRVPVPGDTKAVLSNTASALAGLSSKFASNPEFGRALQDPKFAGWFQKLTQGGGLTWDELKTFREYVGQKMSAPSLNDSISAKDYKTLYAGISKDIVATAQTVGPEAAKAAVQADRYWSAGMTRMDESLSSIFKADSPEKAYQQIITAASAKPGSADVGKLFQLRRSLPDSAWNDISATVIRQMGRPVASASDPLSAANFSVDTFISNWSRLSDKGKDVLFSGQGMKEARDNLDALTRVIAAEKNVDRLRNTSGTARDVGVMALGGGFATAPLKTMAGLAGTYMGSAAMMSPAITKWLVGAATTPLSTLPQHLARLETIAQQEPALAQGIRGFVQALGQANFAPAAPPQESGTP